MLAELKTGEVAEGVGGSYVLNVWGKVVILRHCIAEKSRSAGAAFAGQGTA